MDIKRKIRMYETGIKALELMQNDENFDNWIFLQERIDEMEYHLEWLRSIKNHNRMYNRFLRDAGFNRVVKHCYY